MDIHRSQDVLYWIERAPRFGRQAIFLDEPPFAAPRACFRHELARAASHDRA